MMNRSGAPVVAARLLWIALMAPVGAAMAEAEGTADAAKQSLDQAANDPTASLMAVQFQNVFAGAYHNLADEAGNTVLLRPVIPFKTGDLSHIARATIPLITQSPSGETGLSDSVIFDLIVFDQPWGRWGLGPVMLLPTASHAELGAEKWAAGPALGFVARQSGLMWGLFNQNLISFAGDADRDEVKLSILQPILNISLPHKWSLGTSEMNATYDWDKGLWANLPLGLKVSKLHKFDTLPVQFSASYEYNFADEVVAPEWSLNLTVKFLFPI